MPFEVVCPRCRVFLRMEDSMAGKPARCGNCNTMLMAGSPPAARQNSGVQSKPSTPAPKKSHVRAQGGFDGPPPKAKSKMRAVAVGLAAVAFAGAVLCGVGGMVGWHLLAKAKTEIHTDRELVAQAAKAAPMEAAPLPVPENPPPAPMPKKETRQWPHSDVQSALAEAAAALTQCIAQYPSCFPLIVISISDSKANDSNPELAAFPVRNLATSDGKVLVFKPICRRVSHRRSSTLRAKANCLLTRPKCMHQGFLLATHRQWSYNTPWA